MTLPIEFEVVGSPAAQGSKRYVGNGIMVESSKSLKPWRDSVASAARDIADTIDDAPLDGPLHVTVTFRFPMPASRRKADRDRGWCWKVSAPDCDKAQRALGDALQTAGLIRDDARICVWDARKIEVVGWTGAIVRLEGAP